MEPHTDFDWSRVDEPEAPEQMQSTDEPVFDALRRITRFLRSKDRARLTLDCMALALGDTEVSSMRSVAREHGVTPAAISKRTREIREELHLSINVHNKSASAVEKYRNNRSHRRLDRSP
jgi:hypothetical protein